MKVSAGMCGTSSKSRSHRAIVASCIVAVLLPVTSGPPASAQDLPNFGIRADDSVLTMALAQLAVEGGTVAFAPTQGHAFLSLAAGGRGGPGVTIAPNYAGGRDTMVTDLGYWESPAGTLSLATRTVDWRYWDMIASHGGYSLVAGPELPANANAIMAPIPKSRPTWAAR